MQRRALLASLAAGAASLAGCAGGPGDEPPRTTGPPTTTTRRTSGPPQTTERAPEPPDLAFGDATTAVLETGDRTLSLLGGRRHLPSGVRVQGWLSATATTDHPAEITATIENPTTYTTAVQLGGVGPFSETPFARPSHDVDGGLYLVPTEDHEFATQVPEIARDDDFWYLDDSPGDWHPGTLQLQPGEVAVAKLWVVTHYQYPGVFPTGRYEYGYSDDPLTIVAWQTSKPGPSEPSRFEGASPPGFENMDPAWYHDADATTPVYLQPSAERVAAPARIEFVLHNYLTEPLTGNRYDWSLNKLVDGEWYHIAPWLIPAPLTSVPPGGTDSWTLHAFNGSPVPCNGAIDLGFLGGGRYAFQASLSTKDGASRAALFDLVAPDVTVTPTDDVTSSRDGAVVNVSGPGYRKDDPQMATLVVERGGSPTHRLIPEQVMRRRYQGLRNTLPFFEPGVEQVRLRTDDQTVDEAVGYEGDANQFRFQGDSYVAQRATA